jgi:hypothetical protein
MSSRARSYRASGPFRLACAWTLSVAAVLASGVPSAAATEACPNEALRTGLSASLPDCRAYEMVSPPDKGGQGILPGAQDQLEVAPDGAHVFAESFGIFAGAGSALLLGEGLPYQFARGASSWATTSLAPPGGLNGLGPSGTLTAELQELGSSESLNARLFLYTDSGALTEIGPAGGGATMEGGSADLSRLVLDASLNLPFDHTVGGQHLYQYVGTGNAEPAMVAVSGGPGSTELIGRCGAWAGAVDSNQGVGATQPGTEYNAVSEDGETVFFTVGHGNEYEAPYTHSSCSNGSETGTAPKTSELYARLHGSETVWVSEPECNPASACHNVATDAYTSSSEADAARVVFEGASADGSRVFFSTTQQLVNSDTDTTNDLYEYDFRKPAGERLTQVSAGGSGDATPGSGAKLEGVSRVSEDGSHVYFVAQGRLTTEPNGQGASAVAGADNLYVHEPDPSKPGESKTAFVAELCSGAHRSAGAIDSRCSESLTSGLNDFFLWSSTSKTDVGRLVQATPDGRFFLFVSRARLTAEDTQTNGAAQLFRYDAQTGGLARISVGEGGFNSNGNPSGAPIEVGATIATTGYTSGGSTTPLGGAFNRTMSDDGSYVFFESPVALTAGALNDVVVSDTVNVFGNHVIIFAENVYEYHAGHVYLLSDGRDTAHNEVESDVTLLGTDSTGQDAFFTTADPLVPQDIDTEVDVYDARVGGGYPPPPQHVCTGDECKGAASAPPPAPIAASVTFTGPGNFSPGAAPAGVRVLSRVVHGSTLVLRVQVPGKGRITITGAGIRAVHRSVAKGGTYRIEVTLTREARSTLRHKHKLRLRLRVRFAPASGQSSAATVVLTVEPAPPRHKPGKQARRVSRNRGGAR